jgi:ubiquinone/menaquinone biosynthesis C-methylase UbiE
MIGDSKSEATKERIRHQWDEVAERWDRWTPVMREQFAPATELMLGLARLRPGHRVLDIAAGNGYQSIAAARRVGPAGHVLAIDLAPEQLKHAAAAAREAGIEYIETRVMDAEKLALPDASFDAVLCHFGLMFLPDLDRGLQEMQRVLKPGGWASFVIFAVGGVPESELAASIVRNRLGGDAQAPERLTGGSLGAPGALKRRLEDAGFQAVESHELTVPLRLPSTAEAVRYLREIHPTLEEMMAPLHPNDRDAVWQRVHDDLAAFEGPDGFESPNRVVVVAGERATEPTVGYQ